jgi:hypothetical protein
LYDFAKHRGALAVKRIPLSSQSDHLVYQFASLTFQFSSLHTKALGRLLCTKQVGLRLFLTAPKRDKFGPQRRQLGLRFGYGPRDGLPLR